MDDSYSSEKTIESIIFIIEQVLSELYIKKKEVLGIDISIVAPIDIEKGIMLNPKKFFNSN